MTLLEIIPDLDCRKYRKDYGDPVKNEKDFNDWKNCHELEYHLQRIIRREILHNYYPIRVYDLSLMLRRDYLLGWDVINLILLHIIQYNRFVDVDKQGQDDPRKFLLRLFPRFPVNVQVPYSLSPTTLKNYANSKVLIFTTNCKSPAALFDADLSLRYVSS